MKRSMMLNTAVGFTRKRQKHLKRWQWQNSVNSQWSAFPSWQRRKRAKKGGKEEGENEKEGKLMLSIFFVESLDWLVARNSVNSVILDNNQCLDKQFRYLIMQVFHKKNYRKKAIERRSSWRWSSKHNQMHFHEIIAKNMKGVKRRGEEERGRKSSEKIGKENWRLTYVHNRLENKEKIRRKKKRQMTVLETMEKEDMV